MIYIVYNTYLVYYYMESILSSCHIRPPDGLRIQGDGNTIGA